MHSCFDKQSKTVFSLRWCHRFCCYNTAREAKSKAEGRPESLKSECLMLRLGTMADLLNYVRYFKLNALSQCLWNLITRLERKLRLCFEKTDHDTRKMISIFRFIPSILLPEAKYLQKLFQNWKSRSTERIIWIILCTPIHE